MDKQKLREALDKGARVELKNDNIIIILYKNQASRYSFVTTGFFPAGFSNEDFEVFHKELIFEMDKHKKHE